MSATKKLSSGGTAERKKASVLQSLSGLVGRTIEDEGFHIHCTIVYGILRGTTSFAACSRSPAYMCPAQIRCPVTWAVRPCITERRGQRLCSRRLLAGENALLLTAALASGGRLSGRGCCKESCPVHRICRMINGILVHNSQFVNIFGVSSVNAPIQQGGVPQILDDFRSCVKRQKLYTPTPENSSHNRLDFHTLMC